MRPFFFRQYVKPVDKVRPSDKFTNRYAPKRAARKTGVVAKVLAWLRGEAYDPTVLPKAVRKAARAKARAEFTAKCRRRALRPQGCSIPREVWS